MKILITFILFLSIFYCSAKHLEYSYDASGNRIQRIYLFPRMANPDLVRDSIVEKNMI